MVFRIVPIFIVWNLITAYFTWWWVILCIVVDILINKADSFD